MSRAIDRLPTPAHIREKKVIIIARSRTGTLSLYKAMEILGYRTYHGAEVMRNGVAHMEIFEEALNAKYFGIGKPYGRAEFDKWFADYDAIVEIPAVFLEEMVAAYPNARFVHVERDVDKWYRSIMNTLGHSLKAVDEFPMKQLRLFDNYIDKFCSFHLMVRRLWWHGRELEDGEEVLKRDYIELNRKVREILPKEKLASFNLEDGFGWEQLCPAVGCPIPDVPYPQPNTPARFDALQVGFVRSAIRRVIMLGTTSVLVPTLGIAAWYYMKRR